MKLALSVLIRILLIALGIFAMVAGEFDDSPGLQGIGLIIILLVIYRSIRTWRNS